MRELVPAANASHHNSTTQLRVHFLPADPFHSIELPEVIEEFLDDGVSRCIAFNRRGTLLAGELISSTLYRVTQARLL